MPGTYVENIGFLGKGISVVSHEGPEVTTIDGDSSGSVVSFTNDEGAESSLSGFTITNGSGTYVPSEGLCGGGIYCTYSSPVISNNIIIDNLADWEGGGIYCDHSAPTIHKCVIEDCSAWWGGGLAFESNDRVAVISNCIIMGCYSRFGAGMFCGYSSNAVIKNSVIANCVSHSDGRGGGIYCLSGGWTVRNCTIYGNTAAGGGGISCWLYNPLITDCILWDNANGQIQSINGASPVVTYTDIQNGWSGQGHHNIDADPVFVDLVGGDSHLFFGSPCIDTGDPNFVPQQGETDIDGELRVVNGRVDMGADESPTMFILGEDIFAYELDCNNNGIPDWLDLIRGTSEDCNYDFIPDECQPNGDCNDNGVGDLCDLGDGTSKDCNGNLIPDECDIVDGTSDDCNENATPDECELEDCPGVPWCSDCNANGILDECDIADSGSLDEDGNGVPDECQETLQVPTGDYPTIQSAINAAENGDAIRVAPGTYNENIDFLGKIVVLQSSAGREATVIDGLQVGRVVTFASGEGPHSIIEGFTITHGEGGIYCGGSSPTITLNLITGNTAEYGLGGGGIVCIDSSAPTITGNTITGNSAISRGGGIYCYYSSPMISGNLIGQNSSGEYGGGVYCRMSSPTIRDNIITENSARDFYGGGISCYDSSPCVENNTISGNTAGYGGGVYCNGSSPPFFNNLITGNGATYTGGGIRCYYSSPTITNCTITENWAAESGGGITFTASPSTLTNAILWENSAPLGAEIDVHSGQDPEVTYSDVKDGWPGEGNIDVDPLFIDPANDDYHLLADSPCIDTGDPLSPNIPWGGFRRDMGAFEFDQGFYFDGENLILKPFPAELLLKK
jgi:parallel beta-helix repeat protein